MLMGWWKRFKFLFTAMELKIIKNGKLRVLEVGGVQEIWIDSRK
jgi:hypothetical protein